MADTGALDPTVTLATTTVLAHTAILTITPITIHTISHTSQVLATTITVKEDTVTKITQTLVPRIAVLA